MINTKMVETRNILLILNDSLKTIINHQTQPVTNHRPKRIDLSNNKTEHNTKNNRDINLIQWAFLTYSALIKYYNKETNRRQGNEN